MRIRVATEDTENTERNLNLKFQISNFRFLCVLGVLCVLCGKRLPPTADFRLVRFADLAKQGNQRLHLFGG